MSWTILIYALILGLGPTLWNVLYGRKIVDRTRHIKDFIDTIVDEDEDKKKVSLIESLHIGQNDDEIDALSTASFAPPFARSLSPLTHSRAPHCSLRSRAPLR